MTKLISKIRRIYKRKKHTSWNQNYFNIYKHMRAHLSTDTRVIRAYTHTHVRTCAHACTYTRTLARSHARTHARTHAHIRTHARAHTHTRARAHTLTHIHTHTHLLGLLCCRYSLIILAKLDRWGPTKPSRRLQKSYDGGPDPEQENKITLTKKPHTAQACNCWWSVQHLIPSSFRDKHFLWISGPYQTDSLFESETTLINLKRYRQRQLHT